jgi:hypothetical protein
VAPVADFTHYNNGDNGQQMTILLPIVFSMLLALSCRMDSMY